VTSALQSCSIDAQWRHMVSFSGTDDYNGFGQLHNLSDSLLSAVRSVLLLKPTMSYLMGALGPTPTSSDEIPIPGDVEMKAAAKPTLVPKAEDKELQDDAEMEDLFGNDEGLEAKEENDGLNFQG
jgi:hypothetical protein